MLKICWKRFFWNIAKQLPRLHTTKICSDKPFSIGLLKVSANNFEYITDILWQTKQKLKEEKL